MTVAKVWDGAQWVKIEGVPGPQGPQGPAGPSTSIPVVTALPGSPVDGEEVYLQTAAMLAVGIMWHFRYDASFTGTSKWEFLGGIPWVDEVATGQSTSSTAYAALATAGPSITLPAAGTYEITVQCLLTTATVAGNTAYMSFDAGSTGANDDWAAFFGSPAASGVGIVNRVTRLGLSAAQLAIVSKYRSSVGSAGTITARLRRLSILPVRLT